MKVGFVGLGRMGRAIAQRFIAAGHDLVVYNRSPEKAAEFAEKGATVADRVLAACADREVVVTMLADDAALDQVAFAPGGICDSLPKGAIHMVMGTHGVASVRAASARHAAAGQTLVAAPVLGRPDAAAAGRLGVLTAGPAEAIERCRPLIDAVARRVFPAGETPEQAAVVKLANGLVLGCAIEAMGEAFSLVRKFGVGPEVLRAVMTEGLFPGPAYEGYGRLIAERAWDEVGFTVDLGLKDVRLILAAGGAGHVPLPAVNVLHDHLLSAVSHGAGDRDWAYVAEEQATAAGLPPGGSPD